MANLDSLGARISRKRGVNICRCQGRSAFGRLKRGIHVCEHNDVSFCSVSKIPCGTMRSRRRERPDWQGMSEMSGRPASMGARLCQTWSIPGPVSPIQAESHALSTGDLHALQSQTAGWDGVCEANDVEHRRQVDRTC